MIELLLNRSVYDFVRWADRNGHGPILDDVNKGTPDKNDTRLFLTPCQTNLFRNFLRAHPDRIENSQGILRMLGSDTNEL